ncbi:SDR family oxidoreductase [Proteiniclasticum sp.]|uniref:SDR family oxidoreductase n=1 Tax=Proteiniclasticum sp. TaxID=2053595 RepID=UPI0028A1D419|nr:SDR family oxidoreductase [Proteiniclasticum sp.]
MKILVTGARGNVGRYVVNELVIKGQKVAAGVHNVTKSGDTSDPDIETVYLDLTDPCTFDAALRDVDRVFLMRPPHLGKPEDLYPFIDAMKRHDIRLVSFLSLMGVEKNTIPPHHRIEKYIEKAGLPYAHIRPGFFMQNIAGVHAEEIRMRNEIFIPAGMSRTSFIDAADIGLCVAILLSEPEKYRNTAHTITGPESLNYDEIAEILCDVTERKITYRKPGFLAYRNHYIKKRGLDKTYVNVTLALYFMTRMGTASRVTDGYYRITGKEPRSFRAFASENKCCFI